MRGPNRWAYDAFADINRTYFQDRLPWPEIRWESSAAGPWLGWCDPIRLDAVVIHLHPMLLGADAGDNPWNVPREWLGERWAWDVLLHEAIHVRVAQLCGGRHRGSSPHDNDYWISEVNRLAPLLGFRRLIAGRAGRGFGGRTASRAPTSNVSFDDVELFPYGYRRLTGTASRYYIRDQPPGRTRP